MSFPCLFNNDNFDDDFEIQRTQELISQTYQSNYNQNKIANLFPRNEYTLPVNKYIALTVKIKNQFEFKNWIEIRCKAHPYLWQKNKIQQEWWTDVQITSYLAHQPPIDVCISWLFFSPQDAYISAVQWFQANDIWSYGLQPQDSYVWTAPLDAYLSLTKYFWRTIHQVLFTITSLFALHQWATWVVLPKEEYSLWASYNCGGINTSIAKDLLLTPKEHRWYYRSKESIIAFIGALPAKQQELIFAMVDTLTDIAYQSNNMKKDYLNDDITAALIENIRINRKR